MGLGESYRQALALAREEVGRASGEELRRRAAAVGAELLPPGRGEADDGAIRVSYLGRPLLVRLPGGEVVREEDGVEVPQWLAILTLHYLNCRTGRPLTGELIAFRDLPGGGVYDSNFERRVRARLVGAFSHRPTLLLEAASRLGGEPVEMGDAGVRLLTFPRVPLWVVLWGADEEFPAGANILFDSSVRSYLCTEDTVVLCEQVVSELVKTVREGEVRN